MEALKTLISEFNCLLHSLAQSSKVAHVIGVWLEDADVLSHQNVILAQLVKINLTLFKLFSKLFNLELLFSDLGFGALISFHSFHQRRMQFESVYDGWSVSIFVLFRRRAIKLSLFDTWTARFLQSLKQWRAASFLFLVACVHHRAHCAASL